MYLKDDGEIFPLHDFAVKEFQQKNAHLYREYLAARKKGIHPHNAIGTVLGKRFIFSHEAEVYESARIFESACFFEIWGVKEGHADTKESIEATLKQGYLELSVSSKLSLNSRKQARENYERIQANGI